MFLPKERNLHDYVMYSYIDALLHVCIWMFCAGLHSGSPSSLRLHLPPAAWDTKEMDPKI